MSLLDRVGFLPDGTRVAVEGQVLETLRALKEGDGILGWEGDPNMEIFLDMASGTYDVWTLDNQGEPYMALSRPYCDQRLVVDVLAADTRRRDVAGSVMAHNKRVEAAAKADFAAQVEEHAEKLQWALRRDIGAYEGGLTKMIHPVSGGSR